MFKNEFQGGPYFEIFSAQGKDPTSFWKLQGGSGIRKVYGKDVKSYVYTLEGTAATTKMQIPKDAKQSLMLVQRFVILQVYVSKGQDFSLEIGITDVGNSKRRLNFSTAIRDLSVTPLHAKIPFAILKKSIWLNCCFDMVTIVGDLWRGQTHKAVDSIVVSANCRLRRIFTMKLQPHDTSDDDDLYGLQPSDLELDMIPRSCQIAPDVVQLTQVINIARVREAEVRTRDERLQSFEIDLNSSGRKTSSSDGYHIAFGTKVAAPPLTASQRKGSLTIAASGTSRSSNNSTVRADGSVYSDPQPATSQELLVLPDDKLTVRHNGRRHRLYSENSEDGHDAHSSDVQTGNRHIALNAGGRDVTATSVQPHPPPPRADVSDKAAGRRSTRVRSGGKHRTLPAAVESAVQPSRGNQVSVSAPAHVRTRSDIVDDEELAQAAGDASSVAHAARRHDRVVPQKMDASATTVAALKRSPRSRLGTLTPLETQQVAVQLTLESKSIPLAPIDNHIKRGTEGNGRHLVTTDGSSVTDVSKVNESVGDVIEILRHRLRLHEDDISTGHTDLQDEENDGDVTNNKQDDEGLFQYSSPPKLASRPGRKGGTGNGFSRKKDAKHIMALDLRMDRAHAAEETLDDAVMAVPSVPVTRLDLKSVRGQHTSALNSAGFHTDASQVVHTVMGSPVDGKPLITPRPPESPRVNGSSRPGSGRLRSKSSSAKTSPSTSGSAVVLHEDMPHRLRREDGESGNTNSDATQIERRLPSPKSRAMRSGYSRAAMPVPLSSTSQPKLTSVARLKNLRSSDEGADGSAGIGASLRENSSDSHSHSSSASAAAGTTALLRAELKTGDSDRVSTSVSSQASTRVSRKSLKEIAKDDMRLSKARFSPTKQYDSAKYQMNKDDTFDENDMLEWMKKDQEGGGSAAGYTHTSTTDKQDYEAVDMAADNSSGETSSSEDFIANGSNVPYSSAHHRNQEEVGMGPDFLNESNPREWSECSIFSPPIVLRREEESLETTVSQPGFTRDFNKAPRRSGIQQNKPLPDDKTAVPETDSEEELDLLYDPVLNCYFDPITCKYYELI